jgi:RNA polymerase sigma-70 factor (ECF subfamily)
MFYDKGKMQNSKDKNQFHKLLKRISHKDEGALEEFYNIYGKFIFSTARVITGSNFLADEVLDDVLLKFWVNACSFKKIKSPKGWVYTLTVNCAKDKLKAQLKRNEVFELTEQPAPQTEYDDEFYNKIISLNKQEQQIMVLKFVDDLTFESIAEILDKPLSSISSTYYRALEKLKSNLKNL